MTDGITEIIDNLDDHIEERNGHWRYKCFSEYNSLAMKIDKEVQAKIKQEVMKLGPKNGVLCCATNSAYKVVSRHAAHGDILHFDIKDYYGSIQFAMVEKFLANMFDDQYLYFIEKFYFSENGLRKGLFASPIISEIVGIRIDNLVAKITHEHDWGGKLKYSRYYDDLVFSGLGLEGLRLLEGILTEELAAKGFSSNRKKTKLLKNSSAKILGLRIHNGVVMVPKAFRNKLRLRRHYADWVLANLDFEDYDSLENALMAIGSAIGSLRYVIDNSDQANPKYEALLGQYCLVFAEINNAYNELRDSENPFDGKSAEKAALEMISGRRRPRKKFSDEELIEIDDLISSIRALR